MLISSLNLPALWRNKTTTGKVFDRAFYDLRRTDSFLHHFESLSRVHTSLSPWLSNPYLFRLNLSPLILGGFLHSPLPG